jgi:hypothetical protein
VERELTKQISAPVVTLFATQEARGVTSYCLSENDGETPKK